MRSRILFDIVLIVAAFIAPPWLSLALAAAGLFYFTNFYEIFAVGFIIDGMYGIPLLFFPAPMFYSVSAACLFIFSFVLKKHLSFYR